MTSHYTRGFPKCVGTALRHFLLGSHIFMATAPWLVCEVALSIEEA